MPTISELSANVCDENENVFFPHKTPYVRLRALLKKPVVDKDGALLPLSGVTFLPSSGKIRHLIVRYGENDGETPELYLPFSSAKISAWRITIQTHRPRSPKGTQRLTLDKPAYTVGGAYCGKLNDALIENGVISLLYINDKPFPFSVLVAAGDAIVLRQTPPYPLGETMPKNVLENAREQNGTHPRQITRAALKRAINEGKLIALTTALPLFSSREKNAFTHDEKA